MSYNNVNMVDYYAPPYATNSFVIVLMETLNFDGENLWDAIVGQNTWGGLKTLFHDPPYIKLEDVLKLGEYTGSDEIFEECLINLIRTSPIYRRFTSSEAIGIMEQTKKLRSQDANPCYNLSPIEISENSCIELNPVYKIIEDYEKLILSKGVITGKKTVVYSVFGELYGYSNSLEHLKIIFPKPKNMIGQFKQKSVYVYQNTGIRKLSGLFEYLFDRDDVIMRDQKVRILLVFDNIHDFGNNRKGYNIDLFDEFCRETENKDNCLVRYLIEIIIEKITSLYVDVDVHEHPDDFSKYSSMIEDIDEIKNVLRDIRTFSSGWEKYLLFEMENKLPYIQVRTFNELCTKIVDDDTAVSNDTVSKYETEVLNNERMNDRKVVLLSSVFDGYFGSNPNLSGNEQVCLTNKIMNTEIIDKPPLSIENIYEDGNIEYSFDRGDRNDRNIIVERKFPERYGKGGINSRGCCFNEDCTDLCRTEFRTNNGMGDVYTTKNCKKKCKYDRVDKFTQTCSNKINVDHLNIVAQRSNQEIIKERIDRKLKDIFKYDVSFFLTLKALGDYAQVLEVEKSGNIVFFTQDSMQFLIGSFIGAKVAKGFKPREEPDYNVNYRYMCANMFDEAEKRYFGDIDSSGISQGSQGYDIDSVADHAIDMIEDENEDEDLENVRPEPNIPAKTPNKTAKKRRNYSDIPVDTPVDTPIYTPVDTPARTSARTPAKRRSARTPAKRR